MIDTTSLQIRRVSDERSELIDKYIQTHDPELLKEIERLNDREKALITKNIVERM